MGDELLAAIRAHADAVAPREACGLVVAGAYWPCRNIAHGDEEFQIHPEDWAEAEDAGEIEAVVHSHPGQDPVVPSDADLRAQEAGGIPWVIVGATSTLQVDGLVGRSFIWAEQDCYSLVRDYYRIRLGVHLPDWPHESQFWKDGKDPFLDHHAEAGFHEVAEPEKHDVILMRILSDTPNHSAVYLGDGQVLHHLMGRRSCIDPLDRWKKRITHVMRYSR